MRRIPIFFTFDNNYVEPAAVAFYSLLNKASKDVYYEMYVLSSNLPDERKALLQSVVSKFNNSCLNFIETGNFLDKYWNNGTFLSQQSGSVFTSDTIVRCFAARFFPQYDRIIYSDVDVVFMDDISDLYDANLDGKYIAAVKSVFIKQHPEEIEHLKPMHFEMLKDSYFAGGIWLLNLDMIRRDNLELEMIDVIKDSTIIKKWNDQDIMNIVCKNKVEFIPLNYISYPYLLNIISNENFTSHYSRDELYDSIINPKILHFAAEKPWNGSPNYNQVWWSIFCFLKLKKTNIFVDRKRTLERKIKKYRICSVSLAVLVVVLLIVLAYAYNL